VVTSEQRTIKGKKYAVVRLAQFSSGAHGEVNGALRKAIKGGSRGVVFDLRDNPGGLVTEAQLVASAFLSDGKIVTTKGRAVPSKTLSAVGDPIAPKVPLVVLVDRNSASAAEIVAGALQDRGRAKVLGVTSFGKGSVQTVIPLGPNKGAMRLTTSRYYTPSGKSIQGAGIEPDVEVAQIRLSDKDITEIKNRMARYTEASLPNALVNDQGAERKPPHVPANMPPAEYKGEDFQLDQAVALIDSGKAVVTKDAGAAAATPAPAAAPKTAPESDQGKLQQ
jgi:carboxyl-terminal processing protease